MYDKNCGETIKDIEKEIIYLKGVLSNINQLVSNLPNKSASRASYKIMRFHGNQQKNLMKT